jgi:2-keto-4-pentenoate hydratase/2-oxohepta-3-ene-1,7-dioic acid hydratase in catechol pathway
MHTDPTRFVRFHQGRRTAYGRLEGPRIHVLAGGLFGIQADSGETLSRDAVHVCTPCVPGKILCVGLNYASHLGDRPAPERPEIFLVPPSAQLDPEGTIVLPPGTDRCEFEGELVVVIGKPARNVSEREAPDHIFGVTCGNDISARDWQRNDLQWWRAKGCDTFAPFGPVIARGLDYGDLLLTTRHNGQVKQQQRTSDLIFPPARIVSFISRHMTLDPGDIIYTGTPGSTAPLQSGDTIEVEIEGVGVLRNRVA